MLLLGDKEKSASSWTWMPLNSTIYLLQLLMLLLVVKQQLQTFKQSPKNLLLQDPDARGRKLLLQQQDLRPRLLLLVQ